jgi:nucleotide-binding universal stress UspA family protein
MENMKILIAYDGSECAEIALADLRRAGLPAEAEALVMSLADVFVPPPLAEEVQPKYVPEAIKHAHEHSQYMLEQSEVLAKRASEQIKSVFPNWTISHEAEADSPAWALIRKADEWKPDLIIMGARGHSVFGGRLILGSISQRVLYEARCSVRIARASRKHADEPVRILIGVDNSGDSNAAVDAVCNRSWPEASEVALLAVVDTVMPIADA